MPKHLKLLIHPAIEAERLGAVRAAAPGLEILNAGDVAQARAAIEDADAFFGKLTPDLLAAARRLRWVQSPTASLEHYLFPALVEHPCVLTNMRGLFSDVIADHVLGFVLMFARNFQHYFLHQLAHHWEPMGGEAARVGFATGPGVVTAIDRAHLHLADATLGVIGLGAIGSEVARRARAFGMRIVAVDPRRSDRPPLTLPSPPGGEGKGEGIVAELWKPDELQRLLSASDFVVIAAPHTPRTEKWFRREQFQQMKPTAYLINIGRGAIVDLSDLTEALRADEIAGAGLDVFETEPLPADHPLWDMADRVLITPHVAGCSPRIAERHLAQLVENVRRFAGGEPLQNMVDKAEWF
ncbi:MAG: D-2-hydroxyacid dehydrogenase [Planctomycetes bacterium]|nr:D-2-hydroxyacid dehydrogenase [Planctomycetota bacterium]